jgi:hypothetical protein
MLLGVRSKSYFCVHVALAGATAVFLSFVKLLWYAFIKLGGKPLFEPKGWFMIWAHLLLISTRFYNLIDWQFSGYIQHFQVPFNCTFLMLDRGFTLPAQSIFRKFSRIFYFFEILNFLNLTGRNRMVPLPIRAGMTGNRDFPAGSHR